MKRERRARQRIRGARGVCAAAMACVTPAVSGTPLTPVRTGAVGGATLEAAGEAGGVAGRPAVAISDAERAFATW